MNLSEIDAQLEALGDEPVGVGDLRRRYRPAELSPEALSALALPERLAQVDDCLKALQGSAALPPGTRQRANPQPSSAQRATAGEQRAPGDMPPALEDEMSAVAQHSKADAPAQFDDQPTESGTRLPAIGLHRQSSIPPIDLPPDFEPVGESFRQPSEPAAGMRAGVSGVELPPAPASATTTLKGSAASAVTPRAPVPGAVSGQYAAAPQPLTPPSSPAATSARGGRPLSAAQPNVLSDLPPPPMANAATRPSMPRARLASSSHSGEFLAKKQRPPAVPPPPPPAHGSRAQLRSVTPPPMRQPSAKPPPPPLPRAAVAAPARMASVAPARPDQTAEVDLSELIEIED